MAKVIRLDDDTALRNVGKILSVAGELPTAESVTQVEGNRNDDAAKVFTQLLERRSEVISKRVDSIRDFVRDNAEVLKSAVAALRERDELSARAADQTSSLIDEVSMGKSEHATTDGDATASRGKSKGSFSE